MALSLLLISVNKSKFIGCVGGATGSAYTGTCGIASTCGIGGGGGGGCAGAEGGTIPPWLSAIL